MILFRCTAAFFVLVLSALLPAQEPMRLVLPRTEKEPQNVKVESSRNNLWTITTEHYDILTTHSADAGTETGQRLEHLEEAWRQLFYEALYGKEAKKNTPVSRHRVFLYRDHSDYVENLKHSEQGIEEMLRLSLGYYHPLRQTAYFYPVSPQMDTITADSLNKTLYHEGTHQLFQEVKRRPSLLPGVRNNFWIVEGIAMFMETLQIEDDKYIVGNPDDNRLYAAKTHRLEKEHFFYVPLSELVKMGRADFQKHPTIKRLYSQSAGMTHFFMFYDNGKYRSAALELLRLVYTGAAKPESLSKLTQQSYGDLDAQYETFLKTLP